MVGGGDGVATWAGVRTGFARPGIGLSRHDTGAGRDPVRVSPSCVSKVRARLRELGDARPGAQRNHVPLRLAPFVDALRARIKAVPDAKLDEMRSWLQDTHDVSVSYAVMWKVVARLGLTLKKSTSGPPSRTART